MSDGTDEGVGWKVKADLSEVFKAYDKAEESSKKAGQTAADSAAKAGAAYDKLGQAVQKTGTTIDTTATGGAKSMRTFSDSIDRAIGKINEANTRFASLQGRALALQGQFASGSGMSGGDFLQQIMNAGSLKNFAAGAGGPLMAGVLAGGVAYGVTKQYSDLFDQAQKAQVTARELDGLQKVMSKVGIEATTAAGLVTEFSTRLADDGKVGSDARAALQQYGIATTDSTGAVRDRLSVLGDAAGKIKDMASEEDKLKAATILVGDQFAGQFVAAINKSETGLRNLKTASFELSSSFTTDLAHAAHTAMEELDKLGKRADGVYAQIMRALGLATQADKVKAAEGDVEDAKGRYRDASIGKKQLSTDPDWWTRVKQNFTPMSEADIAAAKSAAEKDALRAVFSLGDERKKAGLDDGLLKDGLSKFSYGERGLVRIGESQDVPKPNPDDDKSDASPGGGRRGGGGGSAKQADDHSAEVIKRLEENLSLARAIGVEHDQIALKMKIEAEQAKLGADATEENKQHTAELVTAIDAASQAQRRMAEEQQKIQQGSQMLANDFANAIDQWAIKGGKFGDVMKSTLQQIESQLLRMALVGSNGSGGLLGGLFGGAGGLLSSLFSGFKADGGDVPAGTWGIAGEAGPEIVRGPANVVPMKSGGQGVIVHNYAAGVQVTPQMTDGRVALIVQHIAGGMIGQNNRNMPSILDAQSKRQ